jgi:hypothetical protein
VRVLRSGDPPSLARDQASFGEATLVNLKRTATIAVVGGALAAWLAGAATSNRSIAPPIIAPAAPIDARGAELANEIARLHERLRPTATPRQPGRNLFAYHAPAPRVALIDPPAPKPALAETLPAVVPSVPSLKLAGIGEDDGPDGPVRVAFISGEGQLFMVKEGENVTSRYQVTQISADVVELRDLSDNTVRRLALR